MRLSPLVAAACASLVIVGSGCSATSTTVAPEMRVVEIPSRAGANRAGGAATRAPGAGEAAHLVWARTKNGEPFTFRIDEAGTTVERASGIRIATARAEYAWATAAIEIPTTACDDGAGNVVQEPQGGRATRARLVPVAGIGREQVVVDAKVDADGANELGHEATVVASLGPLLFVEEHTYAYACGAHGFSSKTFTVWDAEEGAAVDALADLPGAAALLASAKDALGDEGDGFTDPTPPAFTEIFPVLAEGKVAFEAQVTASACYACSDGRWESYTRSVRLPAAPPPVLARHAIVPDAVVAFARRNPDLTVGGASTIRRMVEKAERPRGSAALTR